MGCGAHAGPHNKCSPVVKMWLARRAAQAATARGVWPASAAQEADWPRLAEAGRGWPKREAALRLIWRWRGVLEGELAEASGRLLST